MIFKSKSILAALIGHVLERYDVALYGCFAALLAPTFFPTSYPTLALMSSLGAFAAGYVLRPLGGIIFGYLGDRYGRKKAFTLSIFLVIIPTFTIGILPSYSQIGMFSPIILVTCRLIQGLCNGGEFSGAGIFVGEHMPHKRGFSGGLLCATGILGAAIGTILGMISTLPLIPAWGWRIPFLIGACFTLISYFIRKNMMETPVFEEFLQKKVILKNPFKEVLKKYKPNMFSAIAIGGCGHILLYTSSTYMNVVCKTVLNLPDFKVLAINAAVLSLWVCLSPLMGYFSDKLGIERLMGASALLVGGVAYPLFFFLEHHLNLEGLIIFQLIFITIGTGFVAPISGLFVTLFPVQNRYSGVAFSITLGQAIFGGTTPLVATFLTSFTGNFKAPAFFVMFGAVIGCMGLFRMKRFPTSLSTQWNFEERLKNLTPLPKI